MRFIIEKLKSKAMQVPKSRKDQTRKEQTRKDKARKEECKNYTIFLSTKISTAASKALLIELQSITTCEISYLKWIEINEILNLLGSSGV